MFTRLGVELDKKQLHADDVFSLHPAQLYGYTEALWEAWRVSTAKALPPRGDANVVPQIADPAIGLIVTSGSNLGGLEPPLRALFETLGPGIPSGRATSTNPKSINQNDVISAVEVILKEIVEGIKSTPTDPIVLPPPRPWRHLMYAYLIRNTRVLEVFQRLLREALHGERLSALTAASHRFLRTTEALFFRRGDSSLISSIVSDARPDPEATQRNVFYRMFGFDLTHGTPDGQPYPYEKAEVANRSFGAVFDHFLREVWKGYINATNTSGPTTADDAAILYDIERLREMMRDRRQGGLFALGREEFVAVAMASWFHRAVANNTPIVVDLKATASTPEERLHLLGKRLQVPTHANADSLFELADRLPLILTKIEEGEFTDTAAAKTLYTRIPGQDNPLADDMLEIINHWSRATKTDIKSVPTSAAPVMAMAGR
jgi:hypothetical protein